MRSYRGNHWFDHETNNNSVLRIEMMATLVSKLLTGLTTRQVQFFGRIFGLALYALLMDRRRIAYRNLCFVHPHWSPDEAHRYVRKVFQNFGITLLEMARMNRLSRQQCLDLIQVEGAEHVKAEIMKGRGVIVISAHLGNWETGLQFYPLYFGTPLQAVVKPFKFKSIDRWFDNFRTRFGNQMVPKDGAFDQLMKTLRRGGGVALMMDMTRQKQGLPVRFMGYRASATPAAALLALRSKSPVIPLLCIRGQDGRLTLKVEPPVPMHRSSDLRSDLQYNTQRITDVIEKAVRRNPEQWYWLQKRWKTHYPELYPEYFSARKMRKRKKKHAKSDTNIKPT